MEKMSFDATASTINSMASHLETQYQAVKTIYNSKLGSLTNYWTGNNYNLFAGGCNTAADSLYKLFYDAAINLCTKLHGKVQQVATSEDVTVAGFNTPSITEIPDLNTSTDTGSVSFDETQVTSIKDSVSSSFSNIVSGLENVQQSARSIKNSWEGDEVDNLCTSIGSACTKMQAVLQAVSASFEACILTQTAGKMIMKELDGITEIANDIGEVVADTVNKGVTAVKETVEGATQAAANGWNSLLSMGQGFLEDLKIG